MAIAIGPAVLLRIAELRLGGGPDADDLKRASAASDLLGSKGDLLMFRGGKKGECAHVFNELTHGLAVLAFMPGGVTAFGQHFEANPHKRGPCGNKKAKKSSKG